MNEKNLMQKIDTVLDGYDNQEAHVEDVRLAFSQRFRTVLTDLDLGALAPVVCADGGIEFWPLTRREADRVLRRLEDIERMVRQAQTGQSTVVF